MRRHYEASDTGAPTWFDRRRRNVTQAVPPLLVFMGHFPWIRFIDFCETEVMQVTYNIHETYVTNVKCLELCFLDEKCHSHVPGYLRE